MSEALLLDEMFAPVIARALRERGFDVLSVVERPDLRARSDAELLDLADTEGRRLVTENVKDFRRLHRGGMFAGQPAPVLFTSSRSFPRRRTNPGPLIEALTAWLSARTDIGLQPEEWLVPPA